MKFHAENDTLNSSKFCDFDNVKKLKFVRQLKAMRKGSRAVTRAREDASMLAIPVLRKLMRNFKL